MEARWRLKQRNEKQPFVSYTLLYHEFQFLLFMVYICINAFDLVLISKKDDFQSHWFLDKLILNFVSVVGLFVGLLLVSCLRKWVADRLLSAVPSPIFC